MTRPVNASIRPHSAVNVLMVGAQNKRSEVWTFLRAHKTLPAIQQTTDKAFRHIFGSTELRPDRSGGG